jgi:hypothetical protein
MTFEEIKAAVMGLSPGDQRRLILEVVPAIWGKACVDDSCVKRMKQLVDDETVRKYREEHMDAL